MLKIERSTANNLAVTVTEKTVTANPVYLLRLKNNTTNAEYACIVENTTPNINRYDLFVLTESNTAAPLSATLTLPDGRYRYWFYAQTSTTNLDYELANEEVETGLAQVGDVNDDPVQQVISSDTVINYIE